MVGIVILDYNNEEDTIKCIASVVKNTVNADYKMVVVENGSRETTIQAVAHYLKHNYKEYTIIEEKNATGAIASRFTLLISQTNDGYAEGNNKALRLFDNDDTIDTILILNNDILFTADIIPSLSAFLNSHPDCGIVSPLLVKANEVDIDYNCARHDYKTMQFFWEYLFSFKNLFGIISKYEHEQKYLLNNPDLAKQDSFEIELPSGSCMMMNKAVFRDIGYFDNHTFLYFEENILYRKMLKAGKRNFLIPTIKCIHLGASTSKKSSSLFTMKCQMKSTAYYLRAYRNAPLAALYVEVMSYLTKLKLWIKEKP